MTDDGNPGVHGEEIEGRRGPARPPRPGQAAAPPRPGRPGAVPTEPVADDGPDDRFGSDEDLFDDPPHGDHDHHHDYVDLPGEGSVPKWLAVLVVLAVAATVVVGGSWWWYQKQIDPAGSPGAAVSIEVPTGSSTSGIASLLEDKGVITNSMVFNFYAGRKDLGGFQAGVYEFRENSDFDLVLDTLAQGPTAPLKPKVVKVPIPEGLTTDGVLAKINAAAPRFSVDDLRRSLDGGEVPTALLPDGQSSYEGLLFPATYEVGADTTGTDLLTMLAEEMETRLGGLDVAGAKADIMARWGVEMSTYELLIVASMVQAEAGNAKEAPKIATVIYNRLADGTALGIDAVDRYGAKLAGTEVDYEDSSLPYNTRRQAGLPPTPISAPGEFALEAALMPADGPWMYYVLVEPGMHTFVTTNADFLAAKQLCRERDLGCG